jgi:TetR/AcrR family fatty acid metabolism transcriptional regulator
LWKEIAIGYNRTGGFNSQLPCEKSMRTKTPRLNERMLDAAGRLFGARRFHEVRMEDIAAEAAVSKGTLYRYFEDKEELYLALLRRATDQLVELLDKRMARILDPRDRLVELVATNLEYFDTHPHLFDLIQRAEVLRDRNNEFPWQKARDANLRLAGDIFRASCFAVADADTATLMLLGGLRAVIRFGERPRPHDVADRVVSAIVGPARSSEAG